MKLFGLNLGKEKPISFDQFRDVVRLTARRNHPGATITNTDFGFDMVIDGKPHTCNVRSLYSAYNKNPTLRESLVDSFLKTLVVEIPTHAWSEALPLLRPSLRNIAFIQEANRRLTQQADSLPSQEFAGDLRVIAVVDLPGSAAAATQNILDGWGVQIDEALRHALNNLSMAQFPNIINSLTAGGGGKKGGGEEVGLVFEDNYLTAAWLVLERFRDYVGQRLEGDFIVAVPNRSKLTAVRADEPGLIANLQTANRNYANQPYPLSPKLFHVSAATTGGIVTVYEPAGKGDSLKSDRVFAAGRSPVSPNFSQTAAGIPQRDPLAASGGWGGLNESKEDAAPAPTKKR